MVGTMKLDEQRTLLEWARLQLAIAVSRNPTAAMTVTPATITRSNGYRKLRAWFVHLSPRARAQCMRMLRDQITGVRAVMAKAAETGEELSLADLVIEVRDPQTGEELADAPEIQVVIGCRASGRGIPGVEISGPESGGAPHIVKCPECLMRWSAHDIGFKIPDHEPLI